MPADLGVNSWPGDMDCERHNGLCQWYVCIAYVSVGGILLTPASFDLWHDTQEIHPTLMSCSFWLAPELYNGSVQ